MKKKYEKPVLNASMEGTLEGVYAYGVMGATTCGQQRSDSGSSNGGNNGNGGSVPASHVTPAQANGQWCWGVIGYTPIFGWPVYGPVWVPNN